MFSVDSKVEMQNQLLSLNVLHTKSVDVIRFHVLFSVLCSKFPILFHVPDPKRMYKLGNFGCFDVPTLFLLVGCGHFRVLLVG